MENNHSKPLPKWTKRLFFLIHRHWQYHSPCEHINIKAYFDVENKLWQIHAAPVYQEVYGGDDDGKKVWAGFLFDMGNFSRETGVWIQEYAVSSYCNECTEHPKIMARGKFQGHQIYFHIFLEPIAETEAVELIDTINFQIRDISPKDEQ